MVWNIRGECLGYPIFLIATNAFDVNNRYSILIKGH